MSVQDLKNELFKDKSFKEYFDQNSLSHEIAVSIMTARISRGLSQATLAKKMGIKQPNIARWENGTSSPSNETLEKIAKALDMELILPKFKLLEEKTDASSNYFETFLLQNGCPPSDSQASYVSDSSEKSYENNITKK